MKGFKNKLKYFINAKRGDVSDVGMVLAAMVVIIPAVIIFMRTAPPSNTPIVASPKIVGVTHTTEEVSGGFLGLGTQNVPAVALQFANGTSKILICQYHPWVYQAKVGDRIAEQPDGPLSPLLKGIIQPSK